MKKVTLLLLVLCLGGFNELYAQLYVNPSTGSDANAGTALAPLQSLRQALRNLPGPGTTIYIQEGDYPYATMTSNANRNLGFGPGQSVTTGINNAFLPGTVIEGIGCVYWHNSNDNGTGAQNSIFTVEAVDGFTVRNIKFLGWQGSNASMMFINCTNVLIENCTFHQCALNSATALRFDGDASETAIAGLPNLLYTVRGCTFQNNGNPSGQGTGQALYIRNNGTLHLPPATKTYTVNIENTTFKCNYAATGGALYAMAQNNADEHPVVNINSSNFSGNYASSQGGAVFVKFADLNVTNTGFCNNNANAALSDRDGGAIHSDQGTNLTVSGCTFQDNVSGRYGSAISVASNALTAAISNSVFYSNNLGNSTNSVVRTGGAPTTVNGCLFKDNATNAVTGVTTSNSTFSGNPGATVSGTNVIDDHALPVGYYIDNIGHAWDNTNMQVGFVGTYSTMPNCSACPSVPSLGSCEANGGGLLFTSSATAKLCNPLVGGLTSPLDEITLTGVSGWTPPSCGLSNYRFYYIVIGNDGLIKKVINGDADNDGIPDFAENPAVNTILNLGGLVPGTFSVQGFYSSTGTAPTIGTSTATALAAQTCASLSQGAIWFKNCISLFGNVFNDANGLNDVGGGIVNGPGTNAGGTLFAVLVDNLGNVVANSTVTASGTYYFENVNPNSNYTIVLSTTMGNVGFPAPSPSLPPNWYNVGESNTTGVGNDGLVNGIIAVSVGTNSVENLNFGIDQAPQSTSYSTSIPTPALNTSLPLDGSAFTNVNSPVGTDPESGSLGGSNTIVISTLPTNSTLMYNGSAVTPNQEIPNFNPALLTIVLNTPGSVTTSFNFAFKDPAGIIDPTPATYTISWNIPLPVTIYSFTGNVNNSFSNILNWEVAHEENLEKYIVERSENANHFNQIGFVLAKNQSNYSFIDNNLSASEYYYRLRATDFDGSYLYSNVVKIVNHNSSNVIVLYPNPAENSIHIKFQNLKVKEFIIVNTIGQKRTYEVNASGVYFIGDLANGLYNVVVEGFNTATFIKKN